jgi:hypothetical protein
MGKHGVDFGGGDAVAEMAGRWEWKGVRVRNEED